MRRAPRRNLRIDHLARLVDNLLDGLAAHGSPAHRDPRPPHRRTLPRRLLTPTGRCEPIPGQAHDQIPTERTGVTPARWIEEPVHSTTEAGPARIVHRGNRHAARDVSHPATTRARTPLTRNNTEPCDTCRPDHPPHAAAQDGRPTKPFADGGRAAPEAGPSLRESALLDHAQQLRADLCRLRRIAGDPRRHHHPAHRTPERRLLVRHRGG
jgi:hypothetical protein